MNISALKYRTRLVKFAIVVAAIISAPLLSQSVAEEARPERSPEISKRLSEFLNLELYIYETRIVSREKAEANLGVHLDYQIELEKAGILFGAGPLWNDGVSNGPPSAGLVIVRAASFDEAKAIADADPMHSSGARSYTMRRWKLNEGALTVRLNFSDQTADVK